MIEVSEHDIAMMTKTIIMEARSEPFIGQVAVAWSIRNRHARPGWWSREDDTVKDDTIAAVCVDAWQFSGFNTGDPNLRFAMIIPPTHWTYLKCQLVALSVLLDIEPDPTNGSCHYYSKAMKEPPPWWEGQTPQLDTNPDDPKNGHLFFNDIR